MYKAALQKLFILLMLIVLPVFIIKRHNIFRDRTAYQAQKLTQQVVEIADKHIVVVIPISSHAPDSDKCLKSILSQNYPNYRLLFIDVDHNSQIQSELQTLFTNVRNELNENGQNQFPNYTVSRNYFDAIHSLADDDIVFHIESNSWLMNNSIFERIARIFTNSDIWLAYSPYIDYPTQSPKLDHSKKGEKWWKLHVRKSEWLSSPVKIYYAGLFKQMKITSPKGMHPRIQLNVFLTPLVEKAKRHITYIKDSLYYNDSSIKKQETLVFEP